MLPVLQTRCDGWHEGVDDVADEKPRACCVTRFGPCPEGLWLRILTSRILRSITITDNTIIPLKELVVHVSYDPIRKFLARYRRKAAAVDLD